jgi:hypothetical protein
MHLHSGASATSTQQLMVRRLKFFSKNLFSSYLTSQNNGDIANKSNIRSGHKSKIEVQRIMGLGLLNVPLGLLFNFNKV